MRSRLLFTLASLLTPSIAFAQTTWYVDVNATPPGNGTLATPYSELQFALAQATTVSGDTLVVAPGTYFGGFDFLGKNVVVQSSGGAAVTILDAQGSWPPPVPGPDTSPERSVVSFTHGESAAAVLDGFTVQHGRGTQTVPPFGNRQGGGLHVVNASPTLRSLIVRQNRAVNGGGAYFQGSTSLVEDCTFDGNTETLAQTAHNGLGLYTSSPLTVLRCTFSNNRPLLLPGDGGGAYASAGTFTDCVFQGNSACRGGGAFAGIGNATFTGCQFVANTTGCDGGSGTGAGVYGGTLTHCEIASNTRARRGVGAAFATLTDSLIRDNRMESSPGAGSGFTGAGAYQCTLLRCEVRGNLGVGFSSGVFVIGCIGAGVFGGTATDCDIHENVVDVSGNVVLREGGAGAADATLVRCDIHDNVARTLAGGAPLAPGGGVFGGTAIGCRIWGNQATHGAGAANAALVNCTLAANIATTSAGGMTTEYGAFFSASARNSILWDNVPDQAVAGTGTLTIEWSDVEGGFAGTGNINADPLFQSSANHDFHLLAGSPCIDAGDPTQLDPNGTRIDMGAYPFEAGAHTYCVGKVNSLGCIPTAGFTGTPSLSGPDDFHITGVNIRKNSLGMLLWSRSANDAPFFNATLCVGQPFVRIGIQNSGGTGTGPNCSGQFDFHFTHAYMTLRGIAPFETLFAQWYMRDAAHPDGTSVGVSDAVSFTVGL